jgi:beta-glucanase (GH16 family)
MPSVIASRSSRPVAIRRATAIVGLALVCFPLVTVTSATASSARPAPACGGETVTAATGRPMTCTFDDEFSSATGDAKALDGTKWIPLQTSASGLVSGPTTAAACYVNSANNISVSSGLLNLTARKQAPFTCSDPYGNFSTSYTSGQVTSYTKFSQAYGQFEVRAKLPTTTAKGLQETFWLWPNDATKYGPRPASGEIDFAEFYSSWSGLDVPYLHYNYDASTASAATNTNLVTAYTCPINYGEFNTYSAMWTPGTISIRVNGTTCLTDNYKATGLTSPAPFDQPFFLVLTQALGIGTNAFDPATTPLPATTQVDYVRVWS